MKWDAPDDQMPAPEKTRQALAEGIEIAWRPLNDSKAKGIDRMSAVVDFTAFVNRATQLACQAGQFMAALKGWESAAALVGEGWDWQGTMARMARLASDAPRRESSSSAQERWAALNDSPWWSVKPNNEAEMAAIFDDHDAQAHWRVAIGAMCRATARAPEKSRAAAALIGKWSSGREWEPSSWEAFGRELGGQLGGEKIPNGALPDPIWQALPFDARLGVSLGTHAESKLGQWSCARLIADLAIDGSEEGMVRRRAVCAAFWSALERPRIVALEAAFPQSSDEWLRPGIIDRFDASSDAWDQAEKAWSSKRAAWAKGMLAKAGHGPTDAKPDFEHLFEGPPAAEDYAQALCDLRAMRQAAEIKASLPPKPKSKPGKARSL